MHSLIIYIYALAARHAALDAAVIATLATLDDVSFLATSRRDYDDAAFDPKIRVNELYIYTYIYIFIY